MVVGREQAYYTISALLVIPHNSNVTINKSFTPKPIVTKANVYQDSIVHRYRVLPLEHTGRERIKDRGQRSVNIYTKTHKHKHTLPLVVTVKA